MHKESQTITVFKVYLILVSMGAKTPEDGYDDSVRKGFSRRFESYYKYLNELLESRLEGLTPNGVEYEYLINQLVVRAYLKQKQLKKNNNKSHRKEFIY